MFVLFLEVLGRDPFHVRLFTPVNVFSIMIVRRDGGKKSALQHDKLMQRLC